MRSLLLAVLVVLAISASAQTTYTISVDTNHTNARVYKGLISKSIISQDTTFKWLHDNAKGYKPDSNIVTAVKNAKVKYLVFGGTWCEDTQNILPKFFVLTEQAGVPESAITLFGVDRKKQSLPNVSEAFAVTNVPTIIVLKEGKEIGRIVEYGKTGYWDKELGEIVK